MTNAANLANVATITNATTTSLTVSGNLGVGVTPPTISGGKLFNLNQVGAGIHATSNADLNLVNNAYYNGAWLYGITGFSARYQLTDNVHRWFNAPSGTAGNAITFTQAMTLDASGNLLMGTTSALGYTGLVFNMKSSGSYIGLNASSSEARVFATWDTTAIPMTFYMGGVERARINTNGQFIVRSSLSGAGAITVGNNGGGGDNYGNIGLYTETSLGIGSIRCYDSTSTSLSGSIQWRDNYASLIAPSTNGLGTVGNGGVSFKVYTGSYSDAVVIEPSASMRPGADNNRTLGAASFRWSTVYAATGTINTSDANYKEQIAPLDEAEKRVATTIKGLVKKFKMKDAVAQKGGAARIHVGVIAQEVAAAFVAEGLDPTKYALFCEDTWWEKEYTREEAGMTELVRQSFDTETEGAEKKTRMGIRYEQLLAFIISAM